MDSSFSKAIKMINDKLSSNVSKIAVFSRISVFTSLLSTLIKGVLDKIFEIKFQFM